MKLNKEKFLKTELGGNLQECVESWDFALRGGNKTKSLVDWCQAQWEVYQIMFRQLYNIDYHFSRTDEYFGVCTEDETDNSLTKTLYARQLCGQYHKEKLDAFRDLLESTEDRLIVFYNFNEELNRLKKICESLGREISYVNGSGMSMYAYT